jgi:hypothetical protein
VSGCLRNVFAMVGCATVLVVGGVVSWQYRAQLTGLYRSLTGTPGGLGSASSGRATDSTLASAIAKREALARRNGPAYVVFSAGEVAALVVDGLDPVARAAVDSVTVTLERDRFTLHALLRTGLFTEDLLGPFAGLVGALEPMVVAGPARVAGAGLVAWQPDAFTIRQFPFPASVVPRLVNRMAGRSDGAFPITVPPTVGDLRIRVDGVTFYRRID